MRKYLLTYAILMVFGAGLCAQCCSEPQGLICEDAVFICGQELDGYTYTMSSEISPGNVFPSLCEGGQADNIFWYAFVACESLVQLQITPSDCSQGEAGLMGVQAGIHANCDLSEPVVCFTAGTTSSFILGANAFIPGQVYYLFIDGNGGSVCDIRIDLIAGIDTSDHLDEVEANLGDLEDLNPGTISGATEGCEGMSANYTFIKPECLDYLLNDISCMQGVENQGFLCYEWSVFPSAGVTFLDDVNCGSSVIISYEEAGEYEVSVSVTNSGYGACIGDSDCTTIIPLTVNIARPDTTFLPVSYICNNDCFSFCGQIYCDEDIAICSSDPDNCMVTVQPIELLVDEVIDLGVQWICSQSCFSLQGNEYCAEGNYTIDDAMECHKSYSFAIVAFDMELEGAASLLLTCDESALQPMTSVTTNYTGSLNYEWRDAGNNMVGSVLNPVFSQEGTFTLSVWSDENSNCLYTHTVDVNIAQDEPQYELSVPLLNCTEQSGTINILNITNIKAVNWNGPDGFSSDEISPEINTPGSYTLVLTDENGCTSESVFIVDADFRTPSFEVKHDQINCQNLSTEVRFEADLPIVKQEWDGPNDYFSTDPTITIFKGGTYSLMLTSDNGCTSKSSFNIEEKKDIPEIDLTDEMLWQCNTQELAIAPVPISQLEFDVLWSTASGVIHTDPQSDNIIAGGTGTYYFQVTNRETGCTNIDSVVVRQNEDIPVDILMNAYHPSCFDEADGYIDQLEIAGGQGPYTYQLNNAEIVPDDLQNMEPGSYLLHVEDSHGCSIETSFDLINPEEIIISLPESLEIRYGQNMHLTLEHNLFPEDISSIQWIDENQAIIGQGASILIDGETEGEVRVVLESVDGCTEETKIRLVLDTERNIVAPNIFSPNNDGRNDRFIPFDLDGNGRIIELSVYDRVGQLVYRQNDISFGEETQGWDGTMNGQPLLPGVYVFVMKYESLQGTVKVKAGDLTLVR